MAAMSTFSEGKPPPPPATTAGAETAALDPQILKAGISEHDQLVDLAEEKTGKHAKTKEVPQAGLKNYFRVLSYGTKFDFFLMGLCCLTSIGSGIAMPLMNIVFGQLVGNFTGYFLPGNTVTKHEFQAEINRLALFIVYLFIAKFVMSYISLLTVRISGLRISSALRLAYLRALFAQPVSVIDTVSPGKVSTRITTSSNTIQVGISQHLAMLVQALTYVIGMYVVAFIKGWLLTLVASASLPFILIIYGLLVPPLITMHKITEKHHDDASAMAFEMFSSVRIVVAFGAEAKLARQHEHMLDMAAKNSRRVAPLMGLMMAPSMISMYGTFAITFWFGIKQYTEGKIPDVGVITVVLFSVMMAVMYIGRLTNPIFAIVKAATAATELFVTIDAPTPDTSGLKEPDITADADITFQNVAFSYPSRPNVQILEGLDLKLEAGKVTAIVGPSGSGKSTIVGLVQRWYDLLGTTAAATTPNEPTPTAAADLSVDKDATKKATDYAKKDEEKVDLGPNTCTGTIRVGGTNLHDVDLKWWRSQIGLVQQEPFLFNDTLYNNVAYGLCGTRYEDLPKEEKMKMVEEACREAYAEEFISRLPQGYETLVGESGIKLSGGQRQRIAIARSIVKQPPILILDEATSAIDVRTERIVQQALDRVSKNRTTIVIAHRLSTIQRADKIVVLRQGKLIEQGTHDELLKIEAGVYHGLVHAQELVMEAEEHDTKDSTLERTKTAEDEESDAHERGSRSSEKEEEYKDQGLLRSFGRLLTEQRHHWVLYIIAALGVLGGGAVYPLQAYLFASLINVFTLTGDELVRKGNFWAGMFGILAASVGVAYFVLGVASHLISVAVTRTYRQEYLDNMIRKRISFFDDQGHSPGSLTSRLSTDCVQLQQLMSTEMSFALIALVNLVGSIIIAFVYGWKLSLVCVCSAMPLILVAGYVRMRLEVQFEKDNAKVFENSSQFAAEAVGAFRTVLSLIMEDTIGDRYQTLLQGQVKQAFASAKYGTLVFAASDSIELACMALAFWYGGTLLASREYGLVDFMVVYMAAIQGAIAAGMWFSVAPSMAQATGAANRIISMRPPQNALSPSYPPLYDSSEGVGIDFQNVYFSYKSREVPVLSNLNIKVLPGQFAALVGASGCGKSTTISLLERFYDADSGHILYNGQDITSLDPSEYRKQIALVSQEPTLYEGSITENVALSVETATDEDIKQACRDAQIHDFIASLPDGYATRLGPKGMSLSGGQKQRLSLARALLRKPKLLLLDEATSSLDSESEKLVQEAIERAAGEGGRTVLAVAHRLATIQKADVIFVLGSGTVLESGDHQTLLRKRGVYWQMCQAQALDR
ncbi:P-loop containing nucleoside triphosphate hydrolase protein [Cucurbitaria berberidis CBS 394.84]|uniref:P-loop containing nucleoside triphosphate hydrolase protein n=1 Tax=Cucurbitaria berberidis CBS 394.84 TaxID=1168544 RepID=A0A9P4GSW8_9PLEO|nr:P-loop containing nucleoside triphosphate hydrolase protein [Cucurbitaria berberidis CBS 394.84]KAF1850722.1 P-loop containing nucleoside triphosphate hydrolase protein [Cucurbitaria berberidis CBS 394.84]